MARCEKFLVVNAVMPAAQLETQDRLRSLPWLLLIVLAVAIYFFNPSLSVFQTYPSTWVIPLADWINSGMESFTQWVKPITRLISAGLEGPMLLLRDTLQWIPWPITVASVCLLAYLSSGKKLALFCLLALCYVVFSGYWRQAMNTMALVGIAVILALIIGLLVGILANRTALGARIVPFFLDVMQTMPTFAYLIPLLVIFGFGPVVGLIASAIYACPPMVRNVNLGLQRVPGEIVEAANISGSSAWQKLFWVELPAAIAQIKVGINQTIMATLSMVIIASVIGGFDDIGWEVLNTMRKARFGESLMAGSVIVLIAIVMDRISAGFASKTINEKLSKPRQLLLPAVIALIVATAILKIIPVDINIVEPAWAHQLTQLMDDRLNNIVAASGIALTDLKNTVFYYYLLPLRVGFSQTILPFTWGFDFTNTLRISYALAAIALSAVLLARSGWRAAITLVSLAYLLYFGFTGAPWLVMWLGISLLAWQLGGRSIGLFTLLSLGFIVLTGMWSRAMLSVYLCAAAVVIAFVLGSLLGVWAATSNRASAVIRPVAETFQTIPPFVFLIPVLMFFQVGEFSALLAIIAFAFVPAARYTESGLRQVSPQLLEVAQEQGCTAWQSFWQIRVPLAMPAILVGLNQTIMFAYAMLVIAALVGTTGLGQQIFLALSSADTGLGVIAGLSMALLAMISDRLLQSWAKSKFGQLPVATL